MSETHVVCVITPMARSMLICLAFECYQIVMCRVSFINGIEEYFYNWGIQLLIKNVKSRS